MLEIIENEKLSESNAKNVISKWSVEKCKRFIIKCEESLKEEKRPKFSDSSFVATSSLSGDISDCAGLSCRVKRVDELARFALLYSDRALLLSPFSKYHHHDILVEEKQHLIGDITTILHVKPLLIEDYLFYSEGIRFCSHCYNQFANENNQFQNKLKTAQELLYTEYLDKITCKPIFLGDKIMVFVSGPEELLDHDFGLLAPKDCPEYKILETYAKNQEFIEDKKIKKEIISQKLDQIISDICVQDAYSRSLGLNRVTNNNAQMLLRKNLEQDSEKRNVSGILDWLSHEVPDISNVPLTNLVKFRNAESESFIVYRDSVNSIIRNIQPDTSKDEAKEMLDCQILPELNKISLSIKLEKKKAAKSLIRKSIVGAAFISIGTFSGFVPVGLGYGLTALGGYTFVDTLSEDFSVLANDSTEIKNNPYYFLWKASKL